MNLMLHIVGKDFRRLRGRFAFWNAVMLVKTGLALFLIWSGRVDHALLGQVGNALIVLVATEVALTFLLTAVIVQEDALTGEQPFWRTRPVSGLRLLTAKVIGLFVLLGVPVVLTSLPWWLACGGGLREIAGAVGQMLLMQLVIVAPAVLVASLTATLGRFLIWSLVLFTLPTILRTLLLPALVTPTVVPGIAFARITVVIAVVMVTGIAVVVAQYMGRHRRRSFGLIAVGGALALVAGAWWPWSLASTQPVGDANERSSVSAADLTMEITETKMSKRPRRDRDPELLNTQVRIAGRLPEGAFVGVVRDVHQWNWPDGTEHRARGWTSTNGLEELRVIRRELGRPAPTVAGGRPNPKAYDASATSLLTLGTISGRIRDEPSTYSLTADLIALRPETVMEQPLTGGAWHAQNGRGFRVVKLEAPRQGKPAKVWLLATEFVSRWDAYTSTARRPGVAEARADVRRYFLHERESGRLTGFYPHMTDTLLIIGGVHISMPTANVGEENENPTWARGLSLVLVDWHELATFTRTATKERFEPK